MSPPSLASLGPRHFPLDAEARLQHELGHVPPGLQLEDLGLGYVVTLHRQTAVPLRDVAGVDAEHAQAILPRLETLEVVGHTVPRVDELSGLVVETDVHGALRLRGRERHRAVKVDRAGAGRSGTAYPVAGAGARAHGDRERACGLVFRRGGGRSGSGCSGLRGRAGVRATFPAGGHNRSEQDQKRG